MFQWFKKGRPESQERRPVQPLHSSDGTLVRRQLVFHGRVQNVGFRYHATMIARTLELTGWVKNEYDGTVLMEVQGHPANIDALINELRCQRYIRIDHIESQSLPLEEERGFRETY